MAGGDDPIKRREQARELVKTVEEHFVRARKYMAPHTLQVCVADLYDATVALTKAVKLLIDP